METVELIIRLHPRLWLQQFSQYCSIGIAGFFGVMAQNQRLDLNPITVKNFSSSWHPTTVKLHHTSYVEPDCCAVCKKLKNIGKSHNAAGHTII